MKMSKKYDWRTKVRMLDKLFGEEDLIQKQLEQPPDEKEKEDELPKLQATEAV